MNNKNALELFVEEIGMDPIEAMNKLMDAGWVSDNCVTLADVDESNQSAAIKFLDGLT